MFNLKYCVALATLKIILSESSHQSLSTQVKNDSREAAEDYF